MRQHFLDFIHNSTLCTLRSENEHDIYFSFENLNFIFSNSNDDPYYFILTIPGIEINYSEGQELLDDLTANMKHAKFICSKNNIVSIYADCFSPTFDRINETFSRYITCLVAAREEYGRRRGFIQ